MAPQNPQGIRSLSHATGALPAAGMGLCFRIRTEPFDQPRVPVTVTSSRHLRRVTARLLVGLLVYAQMALAGYACVDPSTLAGNDPMPASATASHDPSMGTTQASMTQSVMCAAHCQAEQQNVDVKPVPVPALALLAGYFTLEPVTSGSGIERPVNPAAAPPPLADPPHAILHCCMRN